ncbi:MAG: 16S rRNA (cytosine(1402)-N(4))-methyltransferase [Candidatus Taylorbacteria bacterium RIFCSPLOWO2_12_FULL_47_20]|uniref:Ribosomal RNA small subunit methyltransferase H n=2 Tax=Candidatus Tayloriibacteriota TaxID=1817919 RepID=A0A1G2PBV9_9BACT|nr:MAG: 16S rRNA (cytosine(1402)-N(4))-methyltransferase [Candidatus Taylorbacteria bacterium RIFCSPLOWO2_02_FULL_46_40]OHA45189.1 MAG: 16S rRNA (cytosine(1402)-N(4))-methyltransferase [Candidatus Taylorbacteria bacterium RIFCSPLOWO2_12_FULL_47_20]
MAHISVLQKEVKEILDLQSGDVLLDATVNGGGHSADAAPILGVHGAIIGIDRDSDAINRSKAKLSEAICSVTLVQDDFRNLDRLLSSYGMRTPTKILFDLGLSSDQLESSGRGFSFKRDEPLIMTFEKEGGGRDITAVKVVNEFGEKEIADIIYKYGEDTNSRRIAKAIVEARRAERILTSAKLHGIIAQAVKGRGKIDPATKTFQALRIFVNDELSAIEEALPKAFGCLAPRGRLAVISFHSLEDRIVKKYFRALGKSGTALDLTKKPVVAGSEEILGNPRSRSAKLRAVEKC